MKTKKEITKKVAAKKLVAKKTASKTKAAVKKVSVVKTKAAVKKVSTTKKIKTISSTKKVVEARKVEKKKLSSLKRSVYMAFSIVFGLLLGTFVELFLELVYMKKMMVASTELPIYYFMGMPSYLPVLVQQFFLLAGLIFGMWLGFWGWRFVYIEKRHPSTKNA